MSDAPAILHPSAKRIGVAADHGGYELKQYLAPMLRQAGHEVIDFGDQQPIPDDDYPDFVAPLSRAIARGEWERRPTIAPKSCP